MTRITGYRRPYFRTQPAYLYPDYKSTVVFVTMDEGGGYYDSGYVQPTSFFGDGTRIPMIAVSPYTQPGHIDHTYTDHASILKFIEANWGIGTIGRHTLDTLPNPHTSGNPYLPTNGPAIGNLMTLFDFNRSAAQIDASRQTLLTETAKAPALRTGAGIGIRVTRSMH